MFFFTVYVLSDLIRRILLYYFLYLASYEQNQRYTALREPWNMISRNWDHWRLWLRQATWLTRPPEFIFTEGPGSPVATVYFESDPQVNTGEDKVEPVRPESFSTAWYACFAVFLNKSVPRENSHCSKVDFSQSHVIMKPKGTDGAALTSSFPSLYEPAEKPTCSSCFAFSSITDGQRRSSPIIIPSIFIVRFTVIIFSRRLWKLALTFCRNRSTIKSTK